MHWSTSLCIKTTIAQGTGHRGPYMSGFKASKHLKRRLHLYKNECFWLGKTLSKYMWYYSIEKRIHKEVEYIDKSTHIHTKQNKRKKKERKKEFLGGLEPETCCLIDTSSNNYTKLFHTDCKWFNGWQLAKMKKSIPDMSLPWNF